MHSLEQAIALIKGEEAAFIIGGAQIYKETIEKDLADQLDITQVHQEFEADVYFPTIDRKVWEQADKEDFSPDEKNKYKYSFLKFVKC